jgi:hypothetical protein
MRAKDRLPFVKAPTVVVARVIRASRAHKEFVVENGTNPNLPHARDRVPLGNASITSGASPEDESTEGMRARATRRSRG